MVTVSTTDVKSERMQVRSHNAPSFPILCAAIAKLIGIKTMQHERSRRCSTGTRCTKKVPGKVSFCRIAWLRDDRDGRSQRHTNPPATSMLSSMSPCHGELERLECLHEAVTLSMRTQRTPSIVLRRVSIIHSLLLVITHHSLPQASPIYISSHLPL